MSIKLSLSLLIVFFGAEVVAQSDVAQYVLQKERITINGRTNINKFECKLDLGGVVDTLAVQVEKQNGNFNFSGLNLRIPVDAFDCKYKLMTAEFRELLRSTEYPHLLLNITHVDHHVPSKMTMATDLSVTDTKNEEFIRDCYIEKVGDDLILGGNHRVFLSSYNIEPPKKLFGAVVVKNELDISFEVELAKDIKKREPQ